MATAIFIIHPPKSLTCFDWQFGFYEYAPAYKGHEDEVAYFPIVWECMIQYYDSLYHQLLTLLPAKVFMTWVQPTQDPLTVPKPSTISRNPYFYKWLIFHVLQHVWFFFCDYRTSKVKNFRRHAPFRRHKNPNNTWLIVSTKKRSSLRKVNLSSKSDFKQNCITVGV